jgi:hypothetical protein
MEIYEIETLIEVSDADGVWSMLNDMGDLEGMAYIEGKYF